jgi:hypothetical protein
LTDEQAVQCLKRLSQQIDPTVVVLIAGHLWKPIRPICFYEVVYLPNAEFPLCYPEKVCRYALLICKFGTEIIAQALCFYRQCGIVMVADGAIQGDNLDVFSHSFSLFLFAPFVDLF